MKDSSFLNVRIDTKLYFITHIYVSLCIFFRQNMNNDRIYNLTKRMQPNR